MVVDCEPEAQWQEGMPMDDGDFSVAVTVMSGPDDGREYRFRYSDGVGSLGPNGVWILTLGRRDDCDLCLLFDTQVSRRHARLVGTPDGRWLLEDVGSRNGTFVGRKRIDSVTELEPGTMFRIGRTWLRLER